MKLSEREKILLKILAFLIISAVYYQFVLIPQYGYLEQMEKKLAGLRQTREEIQRYTEPQGLIRQQAKELDQQIAQTTEQFFPEIVQERVIRIVEEMLASSGLKGKLWAFSPISVGTVLEKTPLPQEEGLSLQKFSDELSGEIKKSNQKEQPPLTGDGNVYKMELSLEFLGSYSQVMALMSEVEKSKRKILISNLVLSSSGDGLKGKLNLHFYAIPKVHQQDKDYFTWDIFDVYGRNDLFAQ